MSRSAFLDPDDPAPQILFHRSKLVKHEELRVLEDTPVTIRFRSLDDALFALRHNERVPQFFGLRDEWSPPFLCWEGRIAKAWRFLTENAMLNQLRRVPRYPEH